MKKALMILVCLLFFIGNNELKAEEDSVLENRDVMITKAEEAVPQISVQELFQKIQDQDDFVLVDVRDPDEWKAGVIHYDNLEKISRGMLEFQGPGQLRQDDRIVVMCATGVRGALAAESLHKLGYTNVSNLQGGIREWIEARYPIKNSLGAFVVN